MVRHIAMFRFSPDATPDQVQFLADGLAELPRLIPSIVAYTFGPDLGVNPGNFHYAVVADFADTDGYVTYRDHEAHRALIRDRIDPIRTERAAVQFSH
jgi:hypothetical protein